jgi:hypothetical protein
MTDSNPPARMIELPRGAIRLGWAGVLPFVGLALAAWWPDARDPAMRAFLAYGALILSFLGGARWGRAMAAGAGTGQFAASVIPSLWGWLAWLLLPPVPALCLLAGGFALVAWWDGRGDAIAAPGSFRRLRRGLSLAVLACHALALAAMLSARA